MMFVYVKLAVEQYTYLEASAYFLCSIRCLRYTVVQPNAFQGKSYGFDGTKNKV
jgi:hypothetical protein